MFFPDDGIKKQMLFLSGIHLRSVLSICWTLILGGNIECSIVMSIINTCLYFRKTNFERWIKISQQIKWQFIKTHTFFFFNFSYKTVMGWIIRHMDTAHWWKWCNCDYQWKPHNVEFGLQTCGIGCWCCNSIHLSNIEKVCR